MSLALKTATPERQPRLLLVDDDPDLLRLLSMRLRASGYIVDAVESAESALAHMAVHPPDLVISDVRLPGRDGLALFDEIRAAHPGLQVILLTAHGSIPDAVDATNRGVFDYISKPFDSRVLLEKIGRALEVSIPLQAQAGGQGNAWRAEIISRSARMEEVLEEARLVARSDASVLVRGASGAGKELLARAIHRASPRAGKPFVGINCGAIPEQLLESELFGHVKGAFTGATSTNDGLFLSADGGTLFLDEIGDMPLPLQVKLLRVLQERAVRPVGATRARGRCTHHFGDPSRSRCGDARRRVPRGSVLPAQRGAAQSAVARRTPRRHPLAGSPFHARPGGKVRQKHSRFCA